MTNDIDPVVEGEDATGPEMERLSARLVEKGTVHFHADWEPGAANMTAEERAALLNAVMDECDHPVLGLAARLSGEAGLYEDSAHPDFDTKTMTRLPQTGRQKSYARTADLLQQGADMLRELHAQAMSAGTAETPKVETRDD